MGQLGRLPPIEVFLAGSPFFISRAFQGAGQNAMGQLENFVIHPLGCYFPLIEP